MGEPFSGNHGPQEGPQEPNQQSPTGPDTGAGDSQLDATPEPASSSGDVGLNNKSTEQGPRSPAGTGQPGADSQPRPDPFTPGENQLPKVAPAVRRKPELTKPKGDAASSEQPVSDGREPDAQQAATPNTTGQRDVFPTQAAKPPANAPAPEEVGADQSNTPAEPGRPVDPAADVGRDSRQDTASPAAAGEVFDGTQRGTAETTDRQLGTPDEDDSVRTQRLADAAADTPEWESTRLRDKANAFGEQAARYLRTSSGVRPHVPQPLVDQLERDYVSQTVAKDYGEPTVATNEPAATRVYYEDTTNNTVSPETADAYGEIMSVSRDAASEIGQVAREVTDVTFLYESNSKDGDKLSGDKLKVNKKEAYRNRPSDSYVISSLPGNETSPHNLFRSLEVTTTEVITYPDPDNPENFRKADVNTVLKFEIPGGKNAPTNLVSVEGDITQHGQTQPDDAAKTHLREQLLQRDEGLDSYMGPDEVERAIFLQSAVTQARRAEEERKASYVQVEQDPPSIIKRAVEAIPFASAPNEEDQSPREKYRKLQDDNRATIEMVGQVIQHLEFNGESFEHSNLDDDQGRVVGGFQNRVEMLGNAEKLSPPEKILRVLPETDRSVGAPVRVIVTTSENLPDPQSQDDYNRPRLDVTFIYEIPSGESLQMRLVGISGEWRDGNGIPSKIVQDESIREFLEQHPDEVSLMGDVDKEVKEAILLQSANKLAVRYRASLEKRREMGATPNAVTGTAPNREAIIADFMHEYPQSERGTEAQEAGIQLLTEVAKLVKMLPQGTPQERVRHAEGLINMLELTKKIGERDAPQIDAQEGVTIPEARDHLRLMPDAMPDLPYILRAKAYFIEGFLFGNTQYTENLTDMLNQERYSLKDRPGEGPLLEAIIDMHERLGRNSNFIIETYGGKEESKWSFYFRHVKRMKDAGKKDITSDSNLLSHMLRKHIAFSEEFVFAHTADALLIAPNAAERRALIERFLQAESIVDVPITYENFTTLVTVGRLALRDTDRETAEKFDTKIAGVARDLGKKVGADFVDEQITNWDVSYLAFRGEPDSVINYVNDSINDKRKNLIMSKDELLEVAAEQYSTNGNFKAVNTIIQAMSPRGQASAYVKYWGEAGSPEEFAELTPPKDEAKGEVDSLVVFLHTNAKALLFKDPDKRKQRALILMSRLKTSVSKKDEESYFQADLYRQQLKQLAQGYNTNEYGDVVSKAILNSSQAAPAVLGSDLQKFLFGRIAKSADGKVAEFVTSFIIGLNGNRINDFPQIIAQMTEFGLQIE